MQYDERISAIANYLMLLGVYGCHGKELESHLFKISCALGDDELDAVLEDLKRDYLKSGRKKSRFRPLTNMN